MCGPSKVQENSLGQWQCFRCQQFVFHYARDCPFQRPPEQGTCRGCGKSKYQVPTNPELEYYSRADCVLLVGHWLSECPSVKPEEPIQPQSQKHFLEPAQPSPPKKPKRQAATTRKQLKSEPYQNPWERARSSKPVLQATQDEVGPGSSGVSQGQAQGSSWTAAAEEKYKVSRTPHDKLIRQQTDIRYDLPRPLEQLEQLNAMGFTSPDPARNVRVLLSTNGDVQRAVDFLLNAQ